MKTWECNGCEKHHMIQSEECPGYCFMTGRAIRNDCREVNGGKFPKLKDEDMKWPSWCMVGAWVYETTQSKYHRVLEISGNDVIMSSDAGKDYRCCSHVKWLREARLRPWAPEEAIGNLGTPFFVNGVCNQIKAIYKDGIIDNNGHGFTFDFLAQNAVFSNGDPVGVLEHFDANREEWVK